MPGGSKSAYTLPLDVYCFGASEAVRGTLQQRLGWAGRWGLAYGRRWGDGEGDGEGVHLRATRRGRGASRVLLSVQAEAATTGALVASCHHHKGFIRGSENPHSSRGLVGQVGGTSSSSSSSGSSGGSVEVAAAATAAAAVMAATAAAVHGDTCSNNSMNMALATVTAAAITEPASHNAHSKQSYWHALSAVAITSLLL